MAHERVQNTFGADALESRKKAFELAENSFKKNADLGAIFPSFDDVYTYVLRIFISKLRTLASEELFYLID